MIEHCLPLPGRLEREWVLWVELWLRAVRHPPLQDVAHELYARLHEWFAGAIAEGVERGEFEVDDIDAATDVLLGAIDGIGVRVLAGDPALPLERARALLLSLASRELGADIALDADPDRIPAAGAHGRAPLDRAARRLPAGRPDVAAGGRRGGPGAGRARRGPVPQGRRHRGARRDPLPVHRRPRLRLRAARPARQRRLRGADRRRVHGAGAGRRRGRDRLARRAAVVRRRGRHDRRLLGRLLRAAGGRAESAGAARDRRDPLLRRPLRRRRALHRRLRARLRHGPLVGLHDRLHGQPPDPAVVGDGWREAWRERLEAMEPWVATWLAHQRRDEYWRQGSACEHYAEIACPVFAVGGWVDGYRDSVLRLVEHVRGPVRGPDRAVGAHLARARRARAARSASCRRSCASSTARSRASRTASSTSRGW